MKSFQNGQILSQEETERLLKTNNGPTDADSDNRVHATPAPAATVIEPPVEPKAVKPKSAFIAAKKTYKLTLLPDHVRMATTWAGVKGLTVEQFLVDILERELEQRGKVGAARIDRPGWAPRQLISGPSGSVKVAAPEPAPAPEPTETSSVDFNF
jgi:hypothetical protein